MSIPCDVGLGTAYERIAIYDLLDRWCGKLGLESALEGPVDGMAGMPGLHLLGLARSGVNVTVAVALDQQDPQDLQDPLDSQDHQDHQDLQDPRDSQDPQDPRDRQDHQDQQDGLSRVKAIYRDLDVADKLRCLRVDSLKEVRGGFDLVLTYNALPLVQAWQPYLDQLARVARRFLLVAVTNPASYGVRLRRMQRWILEREPRTELFDHPCTEPAVLEDRLCRIGRILEHEYLDCPWWPDLFVPTGHTLLSGTMARLLGEQRSAPNGLPPAPPAAQRPSRRSRRCTARRPGRPDRFRFEPGNYPLFPDQPGFAALQDHLRRHPVFDGSRPCLARFFGHHHAYLIQIQS